MINNRCVNDVLAYCSDPPKPTNLCYQDGPGGYDGLGYCKKDLATCGNYHTASELLLPKGQRLAKHLREKMKA